MIFLYRRPVLDYCAEHKIALGDAIRHVIMREIGHHFGLPDEDMEKIENGG
jgi:predicted Zn-dependent protease with MMP-like domain